MHRRALISICALMAVLTGCDPWAMNGHDAQQTYFNSTESTIDPTNVSQLVEEFRVAGTTTSPVFNGNMGYLGMGSALAAFDRTGEANCSGTPKVCAPIWTAALADPAGMPAVADGVVFVAGRSYNSANQLYAFDAAGQQGCSGTPKLCEPLWTADGVGRIGLIVAEGVVLTINDQKDRLLAFDAAGTVNCAGAPKVCQPLWTSAPFPLTSEGGTAVAEGRVYFIAREAELRVFDITGQESCGGTPVVCSPLWTAPLGGRTWASPTIVGGRVYVPMNQAAPLYQTEVAVFDQYGSEGCSGSPPTCAALVDEVAVGPPATIHQIAAAYGRIFSQAARAIEVFDTASCPGPDCEPLFAVATRLAAPVTVANHLMYTYTEAGIAAFDADGQLGCGGTPRVCSPLWLAPVSQPGQCCNASPVVYLGRVYAPTADGLSVFVLP